MSYIGLDDTPEGIEVTFYDTTTDGDFPAYDLGILPRNVPHTIKFWMKLNPGPDNDYVRIAIDGQDAGQCFTTWENFYRATSEEVPISDRLLFLSGGRTGNVPGVLGGGYLFDNVTTTTAGPGPPGCDLPIEKQADSRTVRAGGLAGFRIAVRNRGRATERNLLVCDRIPRRMTFVSASRRLGRLGRRRCLLIPRLAPGKRAGFHIVLHVDANAPSGTETNEVDETPEQPPGAPSVPGAPPAPGAPAAPTVPPAVVRPDVPGKIVQIPPVNRAKAKVKVVARRVPHRRAPAPIVTG